MSGWNYLQDNMFAGWFWMTCTDSFALQDVQFRDWFEVQQYVGPIQRLYVHPGTGEGFYRILTKPLTQYVLADASTHATPRTQRVIASASTRAKAQEFVSLACVEILPRIKGLTHEAFHELLPSLIEKLAHQTTLQILHDWNVLEEDGMQTVDLAAVIEGIKCDSLMMSITFEYEYKYPPPQELLCETCRMPAVDPYVSPIFAGKVFCGSCAVFEGGNHFLKANNLASMLDELEVYCPFATFGCGAVVPRGELGAHLQECPHVRIVCVNKPYGCIFSAQSKAEAIEHIQFCQFRPAVCNELTYSSSSRSPPSQNSLPLPHHFVHPTRVGDVINAANARAEHEAALVRAQEDKLRRRRTCKCCTYEEGDAGCVCTYHSGTWNGYTFTQVQQWRYNVWKRRLYRGVMCVVHVPVQLAKATTALGVGIIWFSALASVVPAPAVVGVAGSIFSPYLFFNMLFKLPYSLLWGTGEKEKKKEVTTWTCCNKIGSSAEPCEKRGVHTFD